jgi:hypothetical protein
MNRLMDKAFMAAYGKYAIVASIGSAISVAIGVPTNTAATLAFGAIVGFPLAFNLAVRSSSARRGTESPV